MREAIGEFTKALLEAMVIVLIVSFLMPRLQSRACRALSIPLVLFIVFMAMEAMDISLQRISLGALIISLGLLVDDAMITIETMISKIEEGMEKIHAATFAYTSTAFPMLTGTLITICGFLPDRLCRKQHRAIHLLIVCGDRRCTRGLMVRGRHLRARDRGFLAALQDEGARSWSWPLHARFHWTARIQHAAPLAHDRRLPCRFRCLPLRHGFVQRQFFPASNRPGSWSSMTLPKNASIAATETQTKELEEVLRETPTLPTSPPTWAVAPSVSTCRSTCSSTTTSWRKRWSSRRTSRRGTAFW